MPSDAFLDQLTCSLGQFQVALSSAIFRLEQVMALPESPERNRIALELKQQMSWLRRQAAEMKSQLTDYKEVRHDQ